MEVIQDSLWTIRQSTSSARLVQRLSCITSIVTRSYWPRGCACPVPRARFGKSCTCTGASPPHIAGNTSRWNVPSPSAAFQLDLKDASSVPPDPEGKQQHVVETFDILDVGTSIALAVEPGEDYTAETVFTPVVETLREYGLPDRSEERR